MIWNSEDLICEAKNPNKPPEEQQEPVVVWPIVVVLLLLILVFGVICYFVRKNRKRDETKTETETENKGDIMTDQKITDRPLGNNK